VPPHSRVHCDSASAGVGFLCSRPPGMDVRRMNLEGRPTNRYPHGPRPAILGGDAHQERGSVALAVGQRDRDRAGHRQEAGGGPKSLLKPFAFIVTTRGPKFRSRASAIVTVRSRTLRSISLPCIFISSGRHGTSLNSWRPLTTVETLHWQVDRGWLDSQRGCRASFGPVLSGPRHR
jgi:hypothetical protein